MFWLICVTVNIQNVPRWLECRQGEVCAFWSGLFCSQKCGSSYFMLLHYCTFGLEAANDAQNIRVDRACGKDNNQQNISKMTM